MALAIKVLKYLLLVHISLTFYTNEVSSASHVTPPSSRAKVSPRLVAVQGMVYCKSCKYSGIDTLVGASPLQGATVRLACNITKRSSVTMETKTDKNGYFFMLAPKTLTTKAVHTCRAWPMNTKPASETMRTITRPAPATTACTVLTQLNNGTTGAILKPSKTINIGEHDYVLFSAGPFAFEPVCKH
ncbi:Non-classical arabinogalactan protein 31 [Cardamine amara subsp. amara]|uniref:Non-classical arabinogalactan protein 31 n=1 Tax=Cardamine amara subsp. amara TaxID=228776 RepID=A0ABD0YYV7_CARAN